MSFFDEYLKINQFDTHLNFVFHALILFTFLSLFYFMYIVKLTKDIFKSEINHIIEKALASEIEELKKDKNIVDLLSALPLEDIKKEYINENKTVSASNGGISNVVTTVNIMFWIFLIIIIVLLKNKCDNGCDINMSHIILENTIIFILIGSVEFIFFKYIASKYIPVPPSFMTTYFLQNVQKKL